MNKSSPRTRLRLESQIAVITGSTRGIGEEIVRRFVEEGAKVVFSGRSSEKGKQFLRDTGGTGFGTNFIRYGAVYLDSSRLGWGRPANVNKQIFQSPPS